MNIRLATYYHAKDVPALPGSNIFHSTELFHVLEQTRGVRPLLLVAYEGKSPVGKLLCITRCSTNLLRFAEKSYAYGTGEYFPSSGTCEYGGKPETKQPESRCQPKRRRQTRC